MQLWSFFASFVGGIYFLFAVLALRVWSRTRYKIALIQFLLAMANLGGTVAAIVVVNTGTIGNSHFYLNAALYFFGSLAVCTYFYAITMFFQWDNFLSKWLPRIMVGVVVSGLFIYLMPILTNSLGLAYESAHKTARNPFVTALYGSYAPGTLIKASLLIGGAVSIFGHGYFFVKILKSGKSELIFLGGIILTLLGVFNDNLIGGLDIPWLVPISMIGFLLECFRFNVHIFESLKIEKEALNLKVKELAIYSQAGRIAQQMSHDVRAMIRRLYQLCQSESQSCSEADQLYQDTLNVLKLYNDKITKQKEIRAEDANFELKQILKSLEDAHKNALIDKNIKVVTEIPMGFRVNLSYAEGLVVFDNLMRNSIKALSSLNMANKSIKICASTEKDDILIEFSDSGPGISETDRVYLFDTRISRPGKELGLGLSIVREVLFERGGLIQLSEQKPNTCFELRFPNLSR